MTLSSTDKGTTCLECKGLGAFRDRFGPRMCPACGGTGRIEVVSHKSELIDGLRASGLNPIVIDENTDFTQLLVQIEGRNPPPIEETTDRFEKKALDAAEAIRSASPMKMTPERAAEMVEQYRKMHGNRWRQVMQKSSDWPYSSQEAFALMWYHCIRRPDVTIREVSNVRLDLANLTGCGHRERIWNSRDGVTPFATRCSSCGGEMQHTDFYLDVFSPEHKPNPGQKVWISMTRERAEARVRQRMETMLKHREWGASLREMDAEKLETYIQQVIESEYHEGQAPDMAIMGMDGVLR